MTINRAMEILADLVRRLFTLGLAAVLVMATLALVYSAYLVLRWWVLFVQSALGL